MKRSNWLKKTVRAKRIEKAKVHGWDTISLDKNKVGGGSILVDQKHGAAAGERLHSICRLGCAAAGICYLEQIVGESQTAALAYISQHVMEKLANGKKTLPQLTEEVFAKLEKEGILALTPKNYGAGPAALHKLAEGGNTVVVIEHNLDVIKTADYIIDMGPEGRMDGRFSKKGTASSTVISSTSKILFPLYFTSSVSRL